MKKVVCLVLLMLVLMNVQISFASVDIDLSGYDFAELLEIRQAVDMAMAKSLGYTGVMYPGSYKAGAVIKPGIYTFYVVSDESQRNGHDYDGVIGLSNGVRWDNNAYVANGDMISFSVIDGEWFEIEGNITLYVLIPEKQPWMVD